MEGIEIAQPVQAGLAMLSEYRLELYRDLDDNRGSETDRCTSRINPFRWYRHSCTRAHRNVDYPIGVADLLMMP